MWPLGCPTEATLESFVCAFTSLGYSIGSTAEFEAGVEKVAIYHDAHEPTHTAKQLRDGSGWWQSKLGTSIDIVHELNAVSGGVYGQFRLVMTRAR